MRAFWTLLCCLTLPAAEDMNSLARSARDAYGSGDLREAFRLADRSVELFPRDARSFALRGALREAVDKLPEALADYDTAIRLEPKSASLFNQRGAARFRAARIAASIEDFDRAIALDPAQEAHNWQRGISYYYAGRFPDGVKQFELHRTVNPDDVENAVWHFLCKARAENFKAARAALIPVKGDSRVPMKEIHDLFAGKATVPHVIAKAGEGGTELFYAYLYTGLYYEAAGDAAKAREHIGRAANDYRISHYMWYVARVHDQLLRR